MRWLAWPLCLLTFIGLAVLDVPDLGTSDLLQACALLLTAWALGDAIRSRRTQQSERLRIAEQEAATARELAARAVVEERLRIARELHDVIAHSMSLIAVQAGVGGHVIRTDVAAAEHALEIIAETSRKALTQTRWMLGLLRGGGHRRRGFTHAHHRRPRRPRARRPARPASTSP